MCTEFFPVAYQLSQHFRYVCAQIPSLKSTSVLTFVFVFVGFGVFPPFSSGCMQSYQMPRAAAKKLWCKRKLWMGSCCLHSLGKIAVIVCVFRAEIRLACVFVRVSVCVRLSVCLSECVCVFPICSSSVFFPWVHYWKLSFSILSSANSWHLRCGGFVGWRRYWTLSIININKIIIAILPSSSSLFSVHFVLFPFLLQLTLPVNVYAGKYKLIFILL